MILSIIIVSYNTKDFLKRCMDSIFTEGGINDLEIIVIDNNSTDGTREMLKKFQSDHSEVITVFNEKNVGFATAVNQGVKKSKSDYLLLLNSDIVIKQQSLEKMISFAKEYPEAGIIGGRLLNLDNSSQASIYHFPTIGRAIKEYWFRQKGSFEKYTPLMKKDYVSVDVVTGAVMLIPRKTIEKIGLLDERYFMYFEDLDYCRRVNKAGYKIYYLPEAEFIHAHGASGKSIPGQTWKWLVRSSQIYHGRLKYYLISLIIWTGQKWQKLWH